VPIRTCSLTSRTSKTRPYATRLDQIHVFPRCKIYMSSYSAVACPEGKDKGIAPPNLLQIFKTYSKLIRTVFVYRYTASVGYFIFARMNVHRESKKQDTKLLAITSPTIIRFSKFFHKQTR